MTPGAQAHRVSYAVDGKVLVHRVGLDLPAGGLLAVVGPNGAGKSTLCAILAGDLVPTEGRVEACGFDVLRTKPHALADQAMENTQVLHLADRIYPTLSGGEQRRVSLARVLAQNTPVVLLDEPTNALDIAHQQLVMALCRRLADEGRAVLAVLHGLNLAGAYADRVLVMAEGRVCEVGAPDEVLRPELLSEVFKQSVMVVPHPETGRPVVLPSFAGSNQGCGLSPIRGYR